MYLVMVVDIAMREGSHHHRHRQTGVMSDIIIIIVITVIVIIKSDLHAMVMVVDIAREETISGDLLSAFSTVFHWLLQFPFLFHDSFVAVVVIAPLPPHLLHSSCNCFTIVS